MDAVPFMVKIKLCDASNTTHCKTPFAYYVSVYSLVLRNLRLTDSRKNYVNLAVCMFVHCILPTVCWHRNLNENEKSQLVF